MAVARSGRTSTRCFSLATSRGTTSGSWCGKGLRTTRGSYRGLLTLFGMDPQDYQRFHNFLAAHECKVDYREFRSGEAEEEPRRRSLCPSSMPGESPKPQCRLPDSGAAREFSGPAQTSERTFPRTRAIGSLELTDCDRP